jgi:NAD(P)H-hydrate epimerase
MTKFNKTDLKNLYTPPNQSNGEDNGQVTVIGGSELFFGAPLLCLKVISRIVDMTFFASPEPSVGEVANKFKSQLFSFVWVPWDELDEYVKKSDAVLIGPGLMRYHKEHGDHAYEKTRTLTKDLLIKFPEKKWVIDAGSLQTMDADWIPQNAILTPNKKEFAILFGKDFTVEFASEVAEKYKCTIVVKGPITYVFSGEETIEVHGGNPGLTKGGTGDVQAALTTALLAKNHTLLSACAGAQIVKDAADELFQIQGTFYNADDLATQIPKTLSNNFRK